MAGRKRTAGMELAIGTTIIAAVVILLVMIFAWGNSSSFLSKHYWLVVVMNNVGGLREGAPVKIGGYQIGKVSSITLRPGATDLEIALSIEEDRLIPKDSTAKISTAGLVGDAFLEIVPSRNAETIKRAASIAEAERIQSHPAPDFSELLVQVNQLGEKLNSLVIYINDILGDPQVRTNIKSIMANLDTVSSEAIILLQRGHRVVDNVERATSNVADISDNLNVTISQVTEKITDIADQAKIITNKIDGLMDTAGVTIKNIDGGVTDVRQAINTTIGDPVVAKNLNNTLRNIADITDSLSARRGDIDAMLANMNTLSGDLTIIGSRGKTIIEGIDPASIAATINSLSGAIHGVTDIVEKIKNDPVLALSVNKAADRIVKMKFDEMAKSPNFKTTDQTMREIQRWTKEAMNRGWYSDPSYTRDNRPYVMDN